MNPAFRAICALPLFVFATAARPTSAEIRYEIFLDHAEQHRFRVQMSVPADASDAEVVVALPAWNATYQIRDFSSRVREVRATSAADAKEPLPVRKLDKQTWGIALTPPGAPSPARGTEISYSIEWDDPGPFSTQLNSRHAFINFADILMYVPGRRKEDSIVVFEHVPPGWRIISELPSAAATSPGVAFAAPGYDALVDAPVEAGKFEEFEFDNVGAHFRAVVDSKEWSKKRLEDALRRITGYELKLIGEAPFKEYTFFFHFGAYHEVGGGGMEHANCTAISAGSVDAAISIAAHEFFHVWNVKRIRPQSLEPVDYAREQYTRALWFAEGVTNTYGAYTLERAGLWSKEQLYSNLAEQINDLESRPAHAWQSAEESSLDAWFEKYELYNRPDRSISYYNKGQILGVMLDLGIRSATENHKSLDDVLRRLNEEYAKQGKFYKESEGIRAVVEEVAGKSFAQFFNDYVTGTKAIPYDEFLSNAGLELKLEAREAPDLGFWPGFAPGTGMQVTAVEAGGRAEAAGLRTGDVLLRLNGEEVMKNPYGVFRSLSAGQNVKLHIRRGEEERDVSYQLGSREDRRFAIVESPHPTDKKRRIREGLLQGNTD